MRQGAWLLYRPQGYSLELQQQLQTVSPNAYRHERIRFQQRIECFRSRYRWQRNSDTVLANLETQWQQAQRAIFTHLPHPNCHKRKLLRKKRQARIKTDI